MLPKKQEQKASTDNKPGDRHANNRSIKGREERIHQSKNEHHVGNSCIGVAGSTEEWYEISEYPVERSGCVQRVERRATVSAIMTSPK